jgi:hypothetical protein
MNPYLKHALIWFAVAFSAWLMFGCASVEKQGVCRHSALYCASIFVESYPTEIALGPPGHAQARAFINGEEVAVKGRAALRSKRDDFYPNQFYPIEQYIGIIKANYWR